MLGHRSLAALVLVLAPALAAADPPAGTAVPVIVGADPDAVFDQAVDAYYGSLSDPGTCAPTGGCHSQVVHRYRVDRKARVELRHASATYGDIYAMIVIDGDGHAWAAGVLDGVTDDDCGMGKCVSTRFGTITVARRGQLLWIDVHQQAIVTRNETGRRARHGFETVIGCQLGTTPACATVTAGGPLSAGRIRIAGTTLSLAGDDGAQTGSLTFPAAP